mgnify:FL=1
MGLDQYAHIRGQDIDWSKTFEALFDKDANAYKPKEHGFVWRKHSRLQVFMAREYENQNPNEDTSKHSGISMGLGFNGDDHKVVITEDVLKKLKNSFEKNYSDCFANDGFFWGQQFQEEQANTYKKQDQQFLKYCEDALKENKIVEYSCSW